MEKTAIEWLIKKITNRQNGHFDGFPHLSVDEIYEQAKEMEKQQIIDAYWQGTKDWSIDDFSTSTLNKISEKYYNETFKQD